MIRFDSSPTLELEEWKGGRKEGRKEVRENLHIFSFASI